MSGGSYNYLYSRLDGSISDAPLATDIRRMTPSMAPTTSSSPASRQ
jgi:hypothetical protein